MTTEFKRFTNEINELKEQIAFCISIGDSPEDYADLTEEIHIIEGFLQNIKDCQKARTI